MQNCFPKANTELFLLLPCLDLRESFSKFNIHKLLHLTEIYLEDFLVIEHMILEHQLAIFNYDMRQDDEFANIADLGSFARKIVETRKRVIYLLVYCFIDLAPVLPIAIASIERIFLGMSVIITGLLLQIMVISIKIYNVALFDIGNNCYVG